MRLGERGVSQLDGGRREGPVRGSALGASGPLLQRLRHHGRPRCHGATHSGACSSARVAGGSPAPARSVAAAPGASGESHPQGPPPAAPRLIRGGQNRTLTRLRDRLERRLPVCLPPSRKPYSCGAAVRREAIAPTDGAPRDLEPGRVHQGRPRRPHTLFDRIGKVLPPGSRCPGDRAASRADRPPRRDLSPPARRVRRPPVRRRGPAAGGPPPPRPPPSPRAGDRVPPHPAPASPTGPAPGTRTPARPAP